MKTNIPTKRSPFYSEPTSSYLPNSPRARGEEAARSGDKSARDSVANRFAHSLEWAEVEKRFGKPMREILLQAHMEHGSFYAMSNALGINYVTVTRWWTDCGLPEFGTQEDGTVTIIVCSDTDTAHTSPTTTEGSER